MALCFHTVEMAMSLALGKFDKTDEMINEEELGTHIT